MIYRLLPFEIQNLIKFSDLESALADSLYSGYIETQKTANNRVNHNDNLKIPIKFDFRSVSGLSHEMVERLERAKPQTFAQVRKIAGLSPTAVSTVLVYISSQTQN